MYTGFSISVAVIFIGAATIAITSVFFTKIRHSRNRTIVPVTPISEGDASTTNERGNQITTLFIGTDSDESSSIGLPALTSSKCHTKLDQVGEDLEKYILQ